MVSVSGRVRVGVVADERAGLPKAGVSINVPCRAVRGEVVVGEANVVDFEELLLPRRSVAELFEIGARLVRENADLPAPCLLCDVSPGVGELSFQLEPEPASVPVLVAWADRFAGVIRAGAATR